MYQCITPKKGIFFMVLAAVAAALIIVLTTVGKALAAPEKVPEHPSVKKRILCRSIHIGRSFSDGWNDLPQHIILPA